MRSSGRSERDRSGASSLPCASVTLPADYAARLERCVPRVAAALERREGGGRASLSGGGLEIAGQRPYRLGDDPRLLDWNLFARLDQPWVRVLRREARERWLVLVDASASMGVGPPGKLQRAAELAGAIAMLGLRRGGEVALARLGGSADDELVRTRGSAHADGELVLARGGAHALGALTRTLERWTASGAVDGSELARRERSLRRSSRAFLLADPFGIDPAAWARVAPLVRASHVIHLLAPFELDAPDERALEWRDPEPRAGEPERVVVELDAVRRAAYARALDTLLERWSSRIHGARRRHTLASTRDPFEAHLAAVFAP